MDTYIEKQNCVISYVKGVTIKFGVDMLNEILRTSIEGLEIYFARKAPYFFYYSHVEVICNIYSHVDLSNEVISTIYP